jgi:hypothetical protein
VLELNAWRRARQDRPLVSYQELSRELAASGPGTFGELDSVGARSVLRRYSDAWFAAAQRRRAGDERVRFPRRRRALMPLRWYHGTFTLTGRVLRIPVARGRPAFWVRLDRDLPCPACGHTGHRDLLAAANIAARRGGGTTSASLPADVTHRRAGAHLPGVAPSRRDPRRRAHHRGARGSPGRHRPAPASPPELARESLATRRGACNSLM